MKKKPSDIFCQVWGYGSLFEHSRMEISAYYTSYTLVTLGISVKDTPAPHSFLQSATSSVNKRVLICDNGLLPTFSLSCTLRISNICISCKPRVKSSYILAKGYSCSPLLCITSTFTGKSLRKIKMVWVVCICMAGLTLRLSKRGSDAH